MVRIVVKDEHPNGMCYYEIGKNAQRLWGLQFLTTTSLLLEGFPNYSNRRFPILIHIFQTPYSAREPLVRNCNSENENIDNILDPIVNTVARAYFDDLK